MCLFVGLLAQLAMPLMAPQAAGTPSFMVPAVPDVRVVDPEG